MDAGQRRTVEAEVILHAVNPELSTTAEGEGKLCPGLLKNNGNTNNGNAPCMGGFLQHDDDDDEFSLPKTFEKEYLLDGSLTVNHNFDHQKGNGLYISKTTRISNDISVHTDSAVNTQNGTRGKKNGFSENSNQAKEEVDGGGLSGRADRSVSGQFVTGNVTSSFAAPDTHCVPAGPRPTDEELAPSFPHSAQAAEPSQCDPLCPGSGLKRCVGNGDSGQTAERAPSLKEPDLIIEVSGQRISAHKSVLAEKSDYFKARLSRDILKVKGVNFKTMSILVDYVYTSQMNVRKDNVVDVITGAKVLQIPCAVQAAMDSMSQQITTDNCYEILNIAKKQRLNELKETAYRFMSDNFLQILKDPSVYGRLTGSERDLVLKKRMEGKRTLMVAEINDVFDRVGSRPASRCNSRPQSPLSVVSFEDNHMIYFFSEAANDWRPLTMMPEDINTKGCGICTMYNYLFVAGGIKGYGEKGKVSDKVFCYNPITNNWTEVRPLTQARSQLKLVSMDGCLYAIGGECLFTVEKYDPRMDRWTTVAALPKGAFAVAHEATTCNGELYVSGGSLFYRLLKYDTKRDEWQECPYNNSRKKSTDMVAFKNFIYRFDVNREQGINVFKYNTIVKMWHDVASQRLGSHLPFRCAVIGNCIYCVNKTQTLQFIVQEENASYFVEEPLPAPLEAKGVLFPFVLSLPEKSDKVI